MYYVLSLPILQYMQAYYRDIYFPKHLVFTIGRFRRFWWRVEYPGLNCTADQRESVLHHSLSFSDSPFLDEENDVNLTTSFGLVRPCIIDIACRGDVFLIQAHTTEWPWRCHKSRLLACLDHLNNWLEWHHDWSLTHAVNVWGGQKSSAAPIHAVQWLSIVVCSQPQSNYGKQGHWKHVYQISGIYYTYGT